MTSPVTASGTPPITSISCPDDGDDVVADDIRQPVAALLANDAFYAGVAQDIYYRHPTPATSTSPSYSNATNAFTEIAGLTFVDPTTEDVAVGDVVEIVFTCTAQSTTEASLIALTTQQDSDPAGIEIPAARVRVPAGGLDVPVSLAASFVVTEAGSLIVRAEGAKAVLGGTLTVVEAYRLEARRMRRPA